MTRVAPAPAVQPVDADRLARQLSDGLQTMGVSVSPEAQRRLLDFASLMLRWNRTFNLTAIREPEQVVQRHLIDSLSIKPLLDRLRPGRGLHVVDVGTGPGLPGIPLAIADDGLLCTLVESSGKKAAFLRQCVGSLGLSSVQVRHDRIEAVRAESLLHGPADVIVSRAFSSVRHLLDVSTALIHSQTTVIAMKGPGAAEEIDALEKALKSDSLGAYGMAWRNSHVIRREPVLLPGSTAQRVAIVIAPCSPADPVSLNAA